MVQRYAQSWDAVENLMPKEEGPWVLYKDYKIVSDRMARLVETAEKLMDRMDRARSILSDGTRYNNWGMLDTTLDRQAINACVPESYQKMRLVSKENMR